VARTPPHLFVVSGINRVALTRANEVGTSPASVGWDDRLAGPTSQEVLILLLNLLHFVTTVTLVVLVTLFALGYPQGRCGRQLGGGFPFGGSPSSFLRAYPFLSESEDGVSATSFDLCFQDSFFSSISRHLALFFVLRLLVRLSLPCQVDAELVRTTDSGQREATERYATCVSWFIAHRAFVACYIYLFVSACGYIHQLSYGCAYREADCQILPPSNT
jgi:hypothetical protein